MANFPAFFPLNLCSHSLHTLSLLARIGFPHAYGRTWRACEEGVEMRWWKGPPSDWLNEASCFSSLSSGPHTTGLTSTLFLSRPHQPSTRSVVRSLMHTPSPSLITMTTTFTRASNHLSFFRITSFLMDFLFCHDVSRGFAMRDARPPIRDQKRPGSVSSPAASIPAMESQQARHGAGKGKHQRRPPLQVRRSQPAGGPMSWRPTGAAASLLQDSVRGSGLVWPSASLIYAPGWARDPCCPMQRPAGIR
ncbi:hypothetical protein MAPG_07951 [Magnaporthiopsis poae ATCC 64411]|uniref:Uncharacterized protein n=1 Tax=Magnaporthiopsis poae (strain ATCC 64411 / 73-15) TaxID=644358 RepID=A0A0C4E621_MAGP6|nr:hypothetical protein MAPG_07951 [Magnaporthiopsis poae ATCC 64411]